MFSGWAIDLNRNKIFCFSCHLLLFKNHLKMCGRTCLTLEPQEIVKSCRYTTAKDLEIKLQSKDSHTNCKKENCNVKEEVQQEDFLVPEWRSEFNCGRSYIPSFNIAPTDITPVLVSKHHFYDKDDAGDLKNMRIIVPMMWGMIPFWHRGDYRKHGLTTNNCRLEHMLESKLYRGPFRRGQRCVILCEGFYEWQTTISAKPSERAAHLLFMPQKENIKIYDRKTWQPEDVNLLKMAGLFDVWEDECGDKIYSYSVITFESTKIMSWMHHRMPAILETEEQIDDWLEFKNVSDEKALAALRPCSQLEWFRVSNLVNNSRNKSEKCNKPLAIIKQEKPPMNKMMSAWLNIRKRREAAVLSKSSSDDDDDDEEDKTSSQWQAGNSGNTTTTSESESELSAAKRPCYRDFKQSSREKSNKKNGDGLDLIPESHTDKGK